MTTEIVYGARRVDPDGVVHYVLAPDDYTTRHDDVALVCEGEPRDGAFWGYDLRDGGDAEATCVLCLVRGPRYRDGGGEEPPF